MKPEEVSGLGPLGCLSLVPAALESEEVGQDPRGCRGKSAVVAKQVVLVVLGCL